MIDQLKRWAWIAAAGAGIALAGCVQQTKTETILPGMEGGVQFPAPRMQAETPAPVQNGTQPPTPAPKLSAEQAAIVDDTCGEQMQDIVGALMLYDQTHKQLPAKLEDLQGVLPGVQLKFTCPVSGKPYVYVPGGLESSAPTAKRIVRYDNGGAGEPQVGQVDPGPIKRIILYDPDPSHNGKRWCVLAAPQQPGAARYLEAVLITPELFKTYHLPRETEKGN